MAPTLTPVRLRSFLRDIEKPNGIDGCWIWRGGLSKGYAPTYRVAYEWMVGPIPDGLQLDHLCRNTLCVNPHHLEPVTRSENQRRAHDKNWQWTPRLYCRAGHALVGENRRVYSDGGGRTEVRCFICRRLGRTSQPLALDAAEFETVFERVPHVSLEVRGEVS